MESTLLATEGSGRIPAGADISQMPDKAVAGVDRQQVELAVAHLDIDDHEFAGCLALLTADEHSRAKQFRFNHDRRRWCVARAHLRRTLAAALGLDARALRFARHASGKPYLPAARHCHFNLSHAGDVAVVAVSTVTAVGTDVEPVRDIADRDSVIKQFFSAHENQQFAQLPGHDRCQAFFQGWTRKEAVIKATGEGLSADLAAFSVTLAPGEPPQMVAHERLASGAPPWHLWHVVPRAGYVAAVAMQCHARPALVVHGVHEA